MQVAASLGAAAPDSSVLAGSGARIWTRSNGCARPGLEPGDIVMVLDRTGYFDASLRLLSGMPFEGLYGEPVVYGHQGRHHESGWQGSHLPPTEVTLGSIAQVYRRTVDASPLSQLPAADLRWELDARRMPHSMGVFLASESEQRVVRLAVRLMEQDYGWVRVQRGSVWEDGLPAEVRFEHGTAE